MSMLFWSIQDHLVQIVEVISFCVQKKKKSNFDFLIQKKITKQIQSTLDIGEVGEENWLLQWLDCLVFFK